MSLASFEVDMQAVRNFVDLSLSSPYTVPPAIVFVSSVGVFSSTSSHYTVIAYFCLYPFCRRLQPRSSRT